MSTQTKRIRKQRSPEQKRSESIRGKAIRRERSQQPREYIPWAILAPREWIESAADKAEVEIILARGKSAG